MTKPATTKQTKAERLAAAAAAGASAAAPPQRVRVKLKKPVKPKKQSAAEGPSPRALVDQGLGDKDKVKEFKELEKKRKAIADSLQAVEKQVSKQRGNCKACRKAGSPSRYTPSSSEQFSLLTPYPSRYTPLRPSTSNFPTHRAMH